MKKAIAQLRGPIISMNEEGTVTTEYQNNQTQYVDLNTSEQLARENEEAAFLQISQEQALEELRYIRNQKLAQTDWTQMSDINLSEAVRQAWASYRQELRDIPSLYSNLEDVVWPQVNITSL